MQMYSPAHPGLVIKEALESIPMSITQFAAYIGVSRVTLSRVLNGRAGVTPEMSIKISQAFGQEPTDLWFRMQNAHDFWHASRAQHKPVKPITPLKIAA